MDFSENRRPASKAVGFFVVVGLHLLLGWALVSGLARRVVEVVKAPVEVSILEEPKAPPPSYVPPPELNVAPPADAQPSITASSVPPPPAPVVIAPPAPPSVPRPLGTPARIDVSSCEKPEYPRAALRAEATGTTRIRFTIDASGRVAKAEIDRPSGPTREHRSLDAAAVEVLSRCPFKPGTDSEGQPIGGAVATVEYVWKLE
ncbi:hypothetical protein APR50_21540 [Variovorax paradoxus]|uniref:energy transducer TonB n=1 Tax=Variovorax paradoxus TaxID=34073 RepID=UPI0006E718BD|nr:hypothetical protein APR50_21540 [Variovorax paradoxus]